MAKAEIVLGELSGGGGEVQEMSFINGSSTSSYVMNYNSTTNQTDTPTGSYVWNGNFIKNDYSTNPRSFVALAPCRATVLKSDGTAETKDYNTGDTFLTWVQSGLVGNKPFQCGVIVL